MESASAPQQPPPSPPRCHTLPRHTELSSLHRQFLDQNLGTHQDLHTRSPLLLSDLTTQCSHFDAHFSILRRTLTKSTVSWISRSFGARSSLASVNFMLENLSLRTSQCGIGSRRMHKILVEELPQLAEHLRQIEHISKYVDTSSQLEVLVGDLEDAVFSVVHGNGSMFSARLLSLPISMDIGTKQERFLQAIKVMNDIEDVLVNTAKCQPQWRHLLETVDTRVSRTLAVVRPQVLADHRALLAHVGWPPRNFTSKVSGGEVVGLPNPLVLMDEDKRNYYSQTFLALCALQHLQARRENRQCNRFAQKKCGMFLWAIDELVSSIASQMEYHFFKWSEQPEFMFALVYKVTRDFILGVDDVLQPLIDRARLGSYSAKEAWVSAMVQIPCRFLAERVFPVLAERYKEKHMKLEVASSWLHLIDHMVAFDKKMLSLISSETCFFMNSERFEGPSGGPSVLMLFYDCPHWLRIWAKIELKDAWKKLKPELKDERAWLVDKIAGVKFQIDTLTREFLLSTREDYKAPLVAESMLKIAWEMIDRCGTLPAVQQRIQFIRSSAAKLIWYFLNVLVLRCKNTNFSLDYLDDTLIKICGTINAASYIAARLQEWSDDVNFLEMKCDGKYFFVDENNGVVQNTCFFGEEIKSLAELMTNWIMQIITVLLHNFETFSLDYLQNKGPFEQGPDGLKLNRVAADVDSAVSADILRALDTLESQLHLLRMSLNPKDFLDLWRSVADGVDHFISCSIFASGVQFSNEGIYQFGVDMRALFVAFQPFCARPEAFFPCIGETLKVLNMSREEANQLSAVLWNDENRTRCLPLYGISHLSLDQVDKILKSATFTSS